LENVIGKGNGKGNPNDDSSVSKRKMRRYLEEEKIELYRNGLTL
jgi:hypothetical protein